MNHNNPDMNHQEIPGIQTNSCAESISAAVRAMRYLSTFTKELDKHGMTVGPEGLQQVKDNINESIIECLQVNPHQIRALDSMVFDLINTGLWPLVSQEPFPFNHEAAVVGVYPPIIQPDFILSFIRLGHSALDSLVMGVFSIGGGQTAMVQAMPTMWVAYPVPVPIVVPVPQQASPPNSPQGTPAGHGATMTSVTSANGGPSPSSIPAAVNQGVVTGVADNAHADTTSVVPPAQTQAVEKNSKKTAGGGRDRKRRSRYRHFLMKRTPKSVKFRRMVLTKALKNSTTKASNQPMTEGSA